MTTAPKQWVEKHTRGPYTFACIFCGSRKIRRRLFPTFYNRPFLSPSVDVSVCAQCGAAHWKIVEVKKD